MKIDEGYVAVRDDGEFLRSGKVSTHVGYRTWIDLVKDIEQATVFKAAHFPDRDMRTAVVEYGGKFTFVPVQVRREVILKGYGT